MSSNASRKTDPPRIAPQSGIERTNARIALILALAVTLLASFVRFSDLDHYSLWIDEAFSISDATNRLDREGESELGNALSYRFIRLSLDLFGRDEWGARVLPCCAGVLSIGLLTWWLTLRVGVVAGVAGGVLLTFSAWHHFLSQCARYYTLNLLSCLMAGIALEAALRHRNRWLALLAMGLMVVASQIHASSLLFAVGLCIAAMLWMWSQLRVSVRSLLRRQHPALWISALALFAIIYLGWDDGINHLRQKGQFSAHVYAGNLAFYGGVVLWIGVLYAAWRAFVRRDSIALFSFGAAAGTLACGAVLSLHVTVNHQYVVAALPFLIALFACAVNEVHRSGTRVLAWVLLALPASEALAMQALYRGPLGGYRAEWRAAAALLLEHLEPEDVIASNRATILEHYLSPLNLDLRDPRRVFLLGHFNHELLLELMQHPGRVWFLVGEDGTAMWSDIDRESFEAHVRERCKRFASFPRRMGTKELGIEIWLQEPRASR